MPTLVGPWGTSTKVDDYRSGAAPALKAFADLLRERDAQGLAPDAG
jgi:hypothetical protein